MTPEQHALVRESWRRFEPRLRASGLRFYQQLFELDPTLRALFHGFAPFTELELLVGEADAERAIAELAPLLEAERSRG